MDQRGYLGRRGGAWVVGSLAGWSDRSGFIGLSSYPDA